MPINWAPHKNRVIELHQQGMTLQDIRAALGDEYDFDPSERSWRAKLKEWGCASYHGASTRPAHFGPRKKRSKRRNLQTHGLANHLGISGELIAGTLLAPTLPQAEPPDNNILSPDNSPAFSTHGKSTLGLESAFSALECDIGTFDSQRYPLHSALQQGDDYQVAHLISRGTDVKLATKGGLTPLHVAIRFGQPSSCIEMLIGQGAEVHVSDAQGDIPLHWAVRWNHPILGTLLQKSLTINDVENKDGFKPLHLALAGLRLGKFSLSPSEVSDLYIHSGKGNMPTGEMPFEHLIKTLWEAHGVSTKKGRLLFWKYMVSEIMGESWLDVLVLMGDTWVEDIGFIKHGMVGIEDLETKTSILKSLLGEMPDLDLSSPLRDSLSTVGEVLLWAHANDKEPLKHTATIFDALIQAQCSSYWVLHPGDIFRLLIGWVEDFRSKGATYDLKSLAKTRDTTNQSPLMKALDKVELRPRKRKWHIAAALVNKDLFDAFLQEEDGRVPLLIAAEKYLFKVVENSLEADWGRSEGIREQEDEEENFHLKRRFIWPEWEEAKEEKDVNLVTEILLPSSGYMYAERVGGASISASRILRQSAMRVLSEVKCQNLPDCVGADLVHRRVQLAAMLKRCYEWKVEVKESVYKRLVNTCLAEL